MLCWSRLIQGGVNKKACFMTPSPNQHPQNGLVIAASPVAYSLTSLSVPAGSLQRVILAFRVEILVRTNEVFLC